MIAVAAERTLHHSGSDEPTVLSLDALDTLRSVEYLFSRAAVEPLHGCRRETQATVDEFLKSPEKRAEKKITTDQQDRR